jgi:hypothetical protein
VEATLKEVLDETPIQPQRQDGTLDQLRDLAEFARTLGMYDAQDVLKIILGVGLGDERSRQLELGSAAERERCIAAVLGERVDADATGEEGDKIYNRALDDAVTAISAMPVRGEK